MLFVTTLYATVYAVCVWEKRENFPAAMYVVSACWQIISFTCSVPSTPCKPDHTRIEVFSNFTEAEFTVALIGLAIGFITTVLVFFDYRWYEAIHESVAGMKERWNEIFPPKEIPELIEKPNTNAFTPQSVDDEDDAETMIRKLKKTRL